MVFDDRFSTVPSIPSEKEPPTWWNTVDLEENSIRIPLDDHSPLRLLDKDWLSPEELELKTRENIREKHLHQAIESTSKEETTATPPLLSIAAEPSSIHSRSNSSD